MKEIVNQTRLKSLNLNFVLTYNIPVYVFPKLGTYVYFKSIIKQINTAKECSIHICVERCIELGY